MKKNISPWLCIGLIVLLVYELVHRFIVPLSDWVAIAALLVSVVLIVRGGLQSKQE